MKIANLLVAAAMILPMAACNTARWEQENGSTMVRYDPGGYYHERLSQMENLRRTGERVEISGTCASSCTMLMSLPNACVHPDATMRFHGPSTIDGQPLMKWHFDETSQGVANHYPPALEAWYMQTGRHVIYRDFYDLTGAQVIAMGAKSC